MEITLNNHHEPPCIASCAGGLNYPTTWGSNVGAIWFFVQVCTFVYVPMIRISPLNMGWPSPRCIGVSPCLLSCLEFYEPPGDNAQSGPIGHDTKTWEPWRVTVDGAEIRRSPVEGNAFYPTLSLSSAVSMSPAGSKGEPMPETRRNKSACYFILLLRVVNIPGGCLEFLNYQQYHRTTRDRFCPNQRISAFFGSKLFVSIMVLEYGLFAVLLQIVIDDIRLYIHVISLTYKYHLMASHHITTTHPYL